MGVVLGTVGTLLEWQGHSAAEGPVGDANLYAVIIQRVCKSILCAALSREKAAPIYGGGVGTWHVIKTSDVKFPPTEN